MPFFPVRFDVTVLVAAIVITCLHGLKLDFTRSVRSDFYDPNRHQPDPSSCEVNPCEPSRPFLCRAFSQCIPLLDVCDGKPDCHDGFDEDPAVCSAVHRPSVDELWRFLDQQRQWIIPSLFNGADPYLVAYVLTVANTMQDLRTKLGLTVQNERNLLKAFYGALVGDERPLLTLGMPNRAWPEVRYLLQSLYNSGLDVWLQ